MEYEVVQLGPKEIVGIEIRTTNENDQAVSDLGPFWAKFFAGEYQKKIPNKASNEIYGLYCEYEKDETKPYTLVAGCEVNSVGELGGELVAKKVPASKYAVFKIEGEFPHELIRTWQFIWEAPLRRTFSGDFELYPEEWHPVNNPGLLLYIAIN